MKKILSIGIVLLFVVLSCSPLLSAETKEKIQKDRKYLISYNSYIALEYNSYPLNEPIPPNETVRVPVTVIYWTNIIYDFLWIIPWWIRNLFLFGSIEIPMRDIHLEVQNIPDWADINFTYPDILFQIPFEGDTKKVTTDLLINIKPDAPNEMYTIGIVASCGQIKRLNGFSYKVSLSFTPE